MVNEQTLLVSVQAANNEIGTVQPIPENAALAREGGAIFHCDAAQAVGKIPIHVDALDVDLLSLSTFGTTSRTGCQRIFPACNVTAT